MRRAALLSTLVAAACDATAPPPEVVFELPPEAAWATRAEPPPAAVGDLVLVTNNFDDTVSYVDLGLDPPAEIARVPVGLNPIEREGPHHIAFSADGRTAWLGLSNFVPGSGSGPHGAHGAGTADGYAVELDVATARALSIVRVDRNPGDIRLTPDQRFVLLTHFDLLRITEAEPGAPASAFDSRLAVVDREARARAAMVPVCPAAHGIAIAPTSVRAFVACWDDALADVDLAAAVAGEPAVTRVDVLSLPGTIASPECQPYALTQAPSGDTVWVGCFVSGELRAYDTSARVMDPARVVDLGSAALFGAYLDAHTLVVPSQGPDRLHWLDADTADVVHTLDVAPADCHLPHVVMPTPDGARLLLVCEGDRATPGTLLVIDAATRATSHVVTLGLFPDDLALRPARPAR